MRHLQKKEPRDGRTVREIAIIIIIVVIIIIIIIIITITDNTVKGSYTVKKFIEKHIN